MKSIHPIQQQILRKTKAVPLAITGKELDSSLPAECDISTTVSHNIPASVSSQAVQNIPETGSELALAFLQNLR